jgi:hypothetical protein
MFTAIATCVFQILPAKNDAGASAVIFDEALAIVRKVEERRQKSSRVALYTAAREYFEGASTASDNGNSASAAMKGSLAGDESRSGHASISEGVETFSTAVILQILDAAPIDIDSENVRQARIRTVLAFLHQTPPAAAGPNSNPATSAARGQIAVTLKQWRAIERARPLQSDLDLAIEANQQTLDRAG